MPQSDTNEDENERVYCVAEGSAEKPPNAVEL